MSQPAVRDAEAAGSFLKSLLQHMDARGIQFEGLECDHLCYRVATQDEYSQVKSFLDALSPSVVLLHETMIRGRPIATYKFTDRPVCSVEHNGKQYAPALLELPSPKPGSQYASGYEHAEFVLGSRWPSIDAFLAEAAHSNVEWDRDAMSKKVNADVRFVVSPNMSAKFHMQSLEEVIAWEIANHYSD